MKLNCIATLLLLMGCGLADGPRVPAGAVQRSALQADGDGIIIGNGLGTSELVRNALTGQPQTLSILSTTGLLDAVRATEVIDALVDRAAQVTLGYLVQCALQPTQSVLANGVTYTGAYGICPDWATKAPSAACLETVSACLLARNNGLGRQVQVSFRGEPQLPNAVRFTAAKRVPPRPWVYEPRGASLGECSPATMPSGVTRNCQWHAEVLERCTPGTSVLVGLGGQDPAACADPRTYGGMQVGADMMLRVCAGERACEFGDPQLLATNDGVCGTTQPAVRFTCPAEGQFSVMAAPWYAGFADGLVDVGSLNAEPIPEVDVFRVREGAFFGNLFDPKKLGVLVVPDKETKSNKLTVIGDPEAGGTGAVVAYQGMFSCADSQWTEPDAYRFERVCAVSAGARLCAAVTLGPCPKTCRVDDGALLQGDRDLEKCVDNVGQPHRNPLTVFLKDACALVSSASCTRNQ